MNDIPIGIIDSGLGGLTILGHIQKRLPLESVLYIADHGNSPYSEKSQLFIRKRIGKLVEFLDRKGSHLVVIACNTATVAGIEWYRKEFPRITFIGVVPAIKTATVVSKTKRIGVLSTSHTAKSTYQKALIARFAQGSKVIAVGCPELVELVENGKIDGPRVDKTLTKILAPLMSSGIDAVVLGCTHFPFLRPAIRAIVGEQTQILDSGEAVARQVEKMLPKNNTIKETIDGQYRFFTTGDPKRVTHVATKLLGKPIVFTYANI